LRKLLQAADAIDDDGYFRIGNIPKGTPVNLLANIDPEANPRDLVAAFLKIKRTLAEIRLQDLDAEEARSRMRNEVAPALWKVSKIPDLVTDRGHYFGVELDDADKRALIEYLKTL
jgi:hypothetical protein